MPRISPVIREDAAEIAERLGDALDPLAGATLLVTGAAGFLCSTIVDAIAAWNDVSDALPCHVIAVDRLQGAAHERLAHLAERADVEILCCDLTESFRLHRDPDFILHGASIASPPAYRENPLATIDVNVGGTRRLLELARDCDSSLLFLSSSEIYGDPPDDSIPTPESYLGNVSCTGPRACYDESKRLAETLCTTYHRQFGTRVKIARPFNVYGPGQRLDDGRLIPDLMQAALERRPFVLYSKGDATRAFCYATDAICGLLHILVSDADGGVFNVGNDRTEASVADVALALRDLAAPPLEIRFESSADADYLTDNPQRRCPDVTRLRSLADWEPSVDLKTGLERTLRGYVELADDASAA